MRSLGCNRAKEVIKYFLNMNTIELVGFKGGTVEKDFCNAINIPAYNIEELGVEKADNHDPEQEVDFYFGQLIKKGVILPLAV